MNATIAVERENQVKSGVSTSIIVICMALVLWLYKMNIKMPVPLPEASAVEMVIDPPTGGGGGKDNPHETSVPVATQKQSIEETPGEQATKQEKTTEPMLEKPVDNSIENMRLNREKARQDQGKLSNGANEQRNNESGYKGTVGNTGSTDKSEPGVSSTFSGRSFLGGNTSTDCHEAGKVVLEVELLPNGKIMFIDIDPATNGSDCLIKAAQEILKNSSFNASAKPRSNGTITFIFKLN